MSFVKKHYVFKDILAELCLGEREKKKKTIYSMVWKVETVRLTHERNSGCDRLNVIVVTRDKMYYAREWYCTLNFVFQLDQNKRKVACRSYLEWMKWKWNNNLWLIVVTFFALHSPRVLMVMELMEGGELFELVRTKRRFTEKEAVNFTRQVEFKVSLRFTVSF